MAWLPLVLAVMSVLGLAAGVHAVAPVDAVVAEVEHDVVTASDIAFAQRLGLFGFAPGAGPIDGRAIDRLVGVRLALGEARTLGLAASADEVAGAWRTVAERFGGVPAFEAWLDARAIERAWARGVVADDVVWRRFVEVRFRAFVFVDPDELAAALGAGTHGVEEEARARAVLVERQTERELDAWVAERARAMRVRRLLAPGAALENPLGEDGR